MSSIMQMINAHCECSKNFFPRNDEDYEIMNDKRKLNIMIDELQDNLYFWNKDLNDKANKEYHKNNPNGIYIIDDAWKLILTYLIGDRTKYIKTDIPHRVMLNYNNYHSKYFIDFNYLKRERIYDNTPSQYTTSWTERLTNELAELVEWRRTIPIIEIRQHSECLWFCRLWKIEKLQTGEFIYYIEEEKKRKDLLAKKYQYTPIFPNYRFSFNKLTDIRASPQLCNLIKSDMNALDNNARMENHFRNMKHYTSWKYTPKELK